MKNNRVYKILLIIFLSLCYATTTFADTNETKNVQLIKSFFQAIFENENFKPEIVKDYLSQDYIQIVDNNPPMNYQDFINHIITQKKIIPKANITFTEFVAQGDKVAEIHLVKANKKNNSLVEAKIIAVWTIKNGKITKCEEMSKILTGTKEDEKLGHIKE